MRHAVYKVARDFGFAPNPFGEFCTLATCKPRIRKYSLIGDWVIGIGSSKNNTDGRVIYVMEVTEKLTFQDYWNDPRFAVKKPRMNGSLKATKGDNIYHQEDGNWAQLDSHHSHVDGTINIKNLNRDTSGEYVLISDNFYYFGSTVFEIPKHLYEDVYHKGIGWKTIRDDKVATEFINTIKLQFQPGIIGLPNSFHSTDRYSGPK